MCIAFEVHVMNIRVVFWHKCEKSKYGCHIEAKGNR